MYCLTDYVLDDSVYRNVKLQIMRNAFSESVRWISMGAWKADLDITEILKSEQSDLGEAELTAKDEVDPDETRS